MLSLLPHQEDFIKKFEELKFRSLLADEPGLGKTYSALCAYNHLLPNENILIILPPSLINTWIENINMLGKETEILLICNNDDIIGYYYNKNIHITQFDIKNIDEYMINKNKYKYIIISFTNMTKYLKNNECEKFFHLILSSNIIIDEVHQFRNPNHKKNKFNIVILTIIKLMERIIFDDSGRHINIILLSATPITNDPSEIYNYFYLMDRNIILSDNNSKGKKIEETIDIINKKYMKFIIDCDGLYKNASRTYWNINAIKNKLETFMVRRSVNFLSLNIPLKIIHKVAIKINSSSSKVIDKNQLENGDEDDNELQEQKYRSKRIEIGILKAKYIVDLFKSNLLVESKLPNKIIIFFYYTVVGHHLYKYLKQIGIHSNNINYIDGSVAINTRDEIINNFKNHEKSCIFLISLHTCSQGIDLVTPYCSHMLFCEIDYTPSILLQAEGRLIRINNIFYKHIYVWYFILIDKNNDIETDRSSDYFIMNEFLNSKNNLINNIINLCNTN